MSNLTEQAKRFTEKKSINALIGGSLTVKEADTDTETASKPETAGKGASRYFRYARKDEPAQDTAETSRGDDSEIKGTAKNKNIKKNKNAEPDFSNVDPIFFVEPFNKCCFCDERDPRNLTAVISELASYCDKHWESRYLIKQGLLLTTGKPETKGATK